MTKTLRLFLLCILLCNASILNSQIVINEGSNKNYSSVTDEDGEHPDWIELYNAGAQAVDLFDYALSDDSAVPDMWTLPHFVLDPGEFLVIHCSEKDRYATTPSTSVLNTGSFVPQAGWNTHTFTTPFEWDGYSNLMVNICSYSGLGYTVSSVFNQTETGFNACIGAWADDSPASCGFLTGENFTLRPNVLINGLQIGTGNTQNCNTCYPAPYGNWYWGARHQMIFRADELVAAGITAGPIESLSFDVAAPDPQTYDYIDISMNNAGIDEFQGVFMPETGYLFHTNFKISSDGETVYLFTPDQIIGDSLVLFGDTYDISIGSTPDGSDDIAIFQPPTPGSTNNVSDPAVSYATAPLISVSSGFYAQPFTVTLSNPNGPSSAVYYTTDGTYPTTASTLYDGTPIHIYTNSVIRARAFEPGHIASEPSVATYFFNVNHITPILSITTDNANLYGPTGIFDNYNNDWLKEAYVEYFDSIPTHPLLFSQRAGMIQDGGWGGSRSQPQHSFRIKWADNLLGGEPMHYPVIPDRPYRTEFSNFYLRNGSNQYLTLPYKDAAAVRMMSKETKCYYSSYRPISVYINGHYFGLYELREKHDKEKFKIEDNATDETIEILSLSAFYGFVLRAVEGDVNNYWYSYLQYMDLDPTAPDFWEMGDSFFDLEYYTDYIISEAWAGNVDWPGNNIKIYRSDATDYRWRFCTIDLELALQPNGWTDCGSDNIGYILGQGWNNPFTNMFNLGLINERYRTYFINRYADIMNTSYKADHLQEIEQHYFDQTVTEMQNEYQRWADPWNVAGWIEGFNNNHLTYQNELACRSENVRNHIQDHFELNGQVNVTLDVYPAGAGVIKINTIIPGSLPWDGIYFDGVPVTVTAIANPGYTFDHWLSDFAVTTPFNDSIMVINLSMDDILTAYFNGTALPTEIAISEINYNSDDTQNSGDWFEIHNFGSTAVDMTGWKVTDAVNSPAFVFPNAFVLQPGEYIVVVHDVIAFQQQHPTVNNFIGPTIFSLNGSGGSIRLINAQNNEFTSVNYDDNGEWPVIADGYGRTLEIANESADANDPANWFAGCMFGSPGEGYHACPETIMFTEVNYASAPLANGGEWVEIRNTGTQWIDISNWIFRDDSDNSLFQIPANTILIPGEMIVLNSDNMLFEQEYPDVNNHVGPFNFSLGNGGDFLRLYNDQDKLYFSMFYGSESPWPITPNGSGYTLELVDSSANVNDPANWMEGCLYGSPGIYYTPCIIDEVVESSSDEQLQVYPNPTNGMAYIISQVALSPGTTIELIDAFGRVIQQQVLKSSQRYFEIDMSAYASGWYVIRAIGKEGSSIKKILKQD